MCKQSGDNGRNVPTFLYAPARYPLECQGGVVGPGGVSLLVPNMVPALGSRVHTGCSAALTYLHRWPLAINGQRLETDAPGEVSGLLALSRETGFAAPCRTSRLEMNHEIGQLLKPTSPPNSDQQALRLSMVVLRDEPRIYSAVAGRDRREACKRDQSPAGGRQNHACLCFQSSHQQPFCTC